MSDNQILTPLKPSTKHKQFLTWDIETEYPDHPDRIKIIGLYDGKEFKYFNSMDSFIGSVINRKNKDKIFYSHFGGKFDMLFLLDALTKWRYEYQIIDSNGHIIAVIVKISKKFKSKIYFQDSYALMRSSLKKITHGMNVTHIKKEIDFNSCDNDELIEYLRYDVVGLYEALKIFYNYIESLGANVKMTVASTSMNVFRTCFLNTSIQSDNIDFIIGYDINKKAICINAEKVIRNYYFGGRTEVFKRYGEYLFYYDVNSLYPHIMSKYTMPVSAPIYVYKENISKNDKGIFHIKAEIDKDIIPLLPYRMNINKSNKLIFPVGSFEGWYDWRIISKAQKLGYKIEYLEGFLYNYEAIFKDYVDYFYELRKKNSAMKIIAKYLLNSLYGKFAQKREIEQIERYDKITNIEDYYPYNDELGLYKKSGESHGVHIIPSISKTITELAQLTLYEYLEKCDDIYYCDTDSIVTSTKLPTSKKLGDLKIEYEIDKGIFLLPKSYIFEGFNVEDEKREIVIKMKGYQNKDFTFNDFYKALNGDYSSFNMKIENKIYGFKESVNRFGHFTHFGNKIKSIISEYDKRILIDNINTKPIKVHNGIIV